MRTSLEVRSKLNQPAQQAPLRARSIQTDLPGDRLRGACIGACYESALAIAQCSRRRLDQAEANFERSLWLSRNCADACLGVARMLSRGSEADPGRMPSILDACSLACRMFREACESDEFSLQVFRPAVRASRMCEAACARLRRAIETEAALAGRDLPD
ncbi:MAG TPA: hypothetical protein VFI11_01020 [Anaerolineales bacterium]|nr:hypothetical protein [Anaerolineales bacterium]